MKFNLFNQFLLIFSLVHAARITFFPRPPPPPPPPSFQEMHSNSIFDLEEYEPSGPCSLPREPKDCSASERIHIVLVSAQWQKEPMTKEETEMVIKSILSGTRCKLFFHILVTGMKEEASLKNSLNYAGAKFILPVPFPNEGEILVKDELSSSVVNGLGMSKFDSQKSIDDSKSKFDSFDQGIEDDSTPILYSIHHIPVAYVKKQASKLGINITHHSGAGGFSKLFLHEILWNVRRAIYLDVDMVLAEDVSVLWQFFNEMDNDDDLFLFMGDNHATKSGPRSRYPFCSCQMIMDLERLRKQNLTKLILKAFGGQNPTKIWGFRPGDQWIWTTMCLNFQEKCKILPKIWNVSGCSKPRFLGLSAGDRDTNGTCWKIAHFNCLGIRDKEYYALINSDWDDTIQLIKNIPWTKFKTYNSKI